MTLEEALKIREIKSSCTYRKLSEIMGLSGTKMDGKDLCFEALKVIYPDYNIVNTDYPGAKFGKTFDDDNISKYCLDRYLLWVKDGRDYNKWHDYDLYYWWE